MSAKSDDEFKSPERTRQRDTDKEEREKSLVTGRLIWEDWKKAAINTRCVGHELVERLFVLRDLLEKNVKHPDVLDTMLKMVDEKLKATNEAYPKPMSAKATRASKRANWSASAAAKDRTRGGTGRSRRKPPGPSEPGNAGNSALN